MSRRQRSKLGALDDPLCHHFAYSSRRNSVGAEASGNEEFSLLLLPHNKISIRGKASGPLSK
jgi:hypothetical protein